MGSLPVITEGMQERSEIARERVLHESPPGNLRQASDDDRWQEIFRLHIQSVADSIETLHSPNPSTSGNSTLPRGSAIRLPEFNPKADNVDARAWCQTADLCLQNQTLDGGALISVLSRAMKGSAATWFPQATFPNMSWGQYREAFPARFETVETTTATFLRVLSGKPKEGECLAAYGGRILSSSMASWESLSTEQLAASFVMAYLSQVDSRLQQEAFTKNIDSRVELQQELMAVAHRKRSVLLKETFDSKRQKLNVTSGGKCYGCGKVGHKIADCRNSQKSSGQSQKTFTAPRTSVTCFKCGEAGHIASRCPKNGSSKPGLSKNNPQAVHRVNLCEKQPVQGQLSHLGEQFSFSFDSGAECSLMKESIADKFADVVINDHYFEILFHVLPDHDLSFGILVGRKILDLGFAVEMSRTPQSKVNTGELQIRLVDPNRTVQRRPYRLGVHERKVVRDKIKELLAVNIIRPSCSPFASPILLVKKKDGSDRMCVDYRELNSNTVADRYPLPLMADQINSFAGANYFTFLDMASCFHHIPIHPDSIERTAFVTPDGQYGYLSMPFGLKNLKKCSFLIGKVEYLGFEVSSGQIKPNPRKSEALAQLPPPETVAQLRQFIGLTSYFRQFINSFSKLTAPLYRLTSGKEKTTWNPQFENIR
ncbi:uncharacterized protein LOC125501458 [Athalia rosae]|uniref:uncharacterized protein LOC125501458 n=1 Tax=Athalia rosae TaxID=37344 RepID=UPI002033682C|nr:uncharacterized protein LOC125501458 [Athalia rosae]